MRWTNLKALNLIMKIRIYIIISIESSSPSIAMLTPNAGEGGGAEPRAGRKGKESE